MLVECDAAGAAIVPQGGNTGLVGGSVPLSGEIVLSLQRLRDVGPVDAAAAQVTVDAGTTLATVQEHAERAGFSFAVDLSARDSATIGGMIATNAGGVHVIRFGPMAAQVIGLEAVLADGKVLTHLGGLEKDNTGYDYSALLAGSEGTLGVITRARLRLHPKLPHRTVAMVACPSIGEAVRVVGVLRREVVALTAAEVIVGRAMDLVCRYLDASPPATSTSGDATAWLLVEAAAQSDPTDELAAGLETCGDLLDEALVATESAGQLRLWQYREAITEAISAAGVPHKLDVTLPAAMLASFVERVPSVVKAIDPANDTFLFGHIGDGNIHVNVLGDDLDDRIDDAVLGLVAECGGSISAEHGIGTAKKPWLHLNRTPAEIATFRAIKSALDPTGILNPNVLLP